MQESGQEHGQERDQEQRQEQEPENERKLRYADKPAGFLVEKRDDGTALRNDGVELKAANENPLYVLMTLYGEYEDILDSFYDWYDDQETFDLWEKNRRIWHRWVASAMSEENKKTHIDRLDLPADEFIPLSDDEMVALNDKISQEMAKRCGKPVKQIILPPLTFPASNLDFEELLFPEKVLAAKFFFPAAVFSYATFTAEANFREAFFNKLISFENVEFNRNADFDNATFSGAASFHSAIFSKYAYFQKTTFSDYTGFLDTAFNGSAIFDNANFNHSVGFIRTIFSNEARFDSAIFSRWTLFQNTRFGGDASFTKTTFSDEVRFQNARFSGDARFQNATFKRYAFFGEASFADRADFSDSTFSARTDFQHAQFKSRAPHFYSCDMHQNSNFTTEESHWPEVTPSNARDAKNAYGRLRHIMNGLQRYDDEHFFFRQEMRCKERLEGRFYGMLIWFYGLSSDYGHSVFLPLLWLLAIIFAPALCLTSGIFPINEPQFSANWGGFVQALGFSLTNCLPFFGFQTASFADNLFNDLSGLAKVVEGLQRVLSFIFLFLLGLGLRQRMRMK